MRTKFDAREVLARFERDFRGDEPAVGAPDPAAGDSPFDGLEEDRAAIARALQSPPSVVSAAPPAELYRIGMGTVPSWVGVERSANEDRRRPASLAAARHRSALGTASGANGAPPKRSAALRHEKGVLEFFDDGSRAFVAFPNQEHPERIVLDGRSIELRFDAASALAELVGIKPHALEDLFDDWCEDPDAITVTWR